MTTATKWHHQIHVNCRTCAHSTAKPDGAWRCERYDADDIPVDYQRAGCERHVIHPDLVPWELVESSAKWEAVYMIDGKPVRNGEPCANCYSSKELLANPTICATGDDFVAKIRDEFDGRIVE